MALTIHVYGAEQMGLSFSGPSIPFAISGLPGKVSGKQGQLKFQIEFYPEKPGLYTDAVVIRLDGEIVYILPVAG